MTLDHIGSALSLWPVHSDDGGLNIVTGTRKIASDIVSVLLIQPGEDPLHPDMGLAPELFEPLSNIQPHYWCYNAHQEILRWVPGIESLQVEIPLQPDAFNELSANITFVPRYYPTTEILTFGWYAYTGAVHNGDMDTFRRSISLSGTPFFKF